MTPPSEVMATIPEEVRLDPRRQETPLFVCFVFLLAIGCVALFSATSYRSQMEYQDLWTMWAGQFKGYGLGLLFFMVAYSASPRIWIQRSTCMTLAAVLVITLFLTKFTGLGIEKNQARRWLNLGFVVFQPSELAKFVMPAFLIYLTGAWRFQGAAGAPRSSQQLFLMILAFVVLPLFLIVIQPDVGTTAVVGGLCLIPIVRSLKSSKWLISAFMAIAGLIYLTIYITQRDRFTEFSERFLSLTHPEEVPQVYAGFQSIGSGGLFGKGLGEGAGKLGYLPSAFNDFIFAVYAEETGFVGVSVVVLLFGVMLWSGRRLWRSLEDPDLSLLAMVITLSITGQAAFNLMVNLALLPTKGIALPFFSHGSTGLAVFMGMTGVLLALTRSRGKEVLPT